MLDPKIVEALTRPMTSDGLLDPNEERLLDMVAQGTPIKAIAVALATTPADVDSLIGSAPSSERLPLGRNRARSCHAFFREAWPRS